MSRTHFMTGYPGFIAGRILDHLLDAEDDTVCLLCHPGTVEAAKAALAKTDGAVLDENVMVFPGDITRIDLGLDEETVSELAQSVTTVWHLAAVYDLGMGRELGERVNVDGTSNVLGLARKFSRLERFVYFSTAYVSGTREGIIREDELERGQYFKNDYELTKFRAEELVRRAAQSLPITVIRPGIVVGDSKTGETARFDGLYFIMRFLERFKKLPVPVIGDPDVPMNFVPVDYVVDAAMHLGTSESSAGKTYHLTDPQPYTVGEVFALASQALIGKKPSWRLPLRFAKAGMTLPFVRRFFGVERASLDYSGVKAVYDNTGAMADLAGTGISCPDLADYMEQLVRFYQSHKNDASRRAVVH